VAGRKMQKDFEPVLGRKIHHFVNEAQGHAGPAGPDWFRVANALGRVRPEHLGDILDPAQTQIQ
jgi:acetyl-CoA synthase